MGGAKGQTSLDQANGAKLVEEEGGQKRTRGGERRGGCKRRWRSIRNLFTHELMRRHRGSDVADGWRRVVMTVHPTQGSPPTSYPPDPLIFNEIPDVVTNPPDSLRCIHFYSSKIGLIDLLLAAL